MNGSWIGRDSGMDRHPVSYQSISDVFGPEFGSIEYEFHSRPIGATLTVLEPYCYCIIQR